ncbi:hypothetical protein DXG01_012118 [Tephrocybe rancida]|nr:hypothetical protein DXG01_012118 [Tephrocybe rancida]
MDHDRERESSPPRPSGLPVTVTDSGASTPLASRTGPSHVALSDDDTPESIHVRAEAQGTSQRMAQGTTEFSASSSPSIRTAGVTHPTSGRDSFAPASRSNESPPRSIRWNPPPGPPPHLEGGDVDRRYGPPLPPLPHDLRARNSRIGVEGPTISLGPRSGIDYIVPVDEKATREKTVGERLQPTLLTAISERDKHAFKAKMTGYALNIAIGVQVLLGALTTGLSAVTTGHQTSIMTAILGGLSTLSASYLARARGSNEPELSITRVKDLEQYIRECEAFQMDYGHTLGDTYDKELEDFRRRFEELLGNANG